jgi:ribonuclease R
LQHAAEKSSQLERRAMSIEREVVDLYGAYLMRNRVGETYDATVSGVTEHGFYATLDAPCVDVHCRLAALPRDEYSLDAYGVRLSGRYRGTSFGLGDRVRVVIEDVSIAQRKILVVPEGLQAEERSREQPKDSGHRRSKRRDRDKQREGERARGRKTRKARKTETGIGAKAKRR